VKKSLYKNLFFKNFYKTITEEEVKKVFLTSILKLNAVVKAKIYSSSSLENPALHQKNLFSLR